MPIEELIDTLSVLLGATARHATPLARRGYPQAAVLVDRGSERTLVRVEYGGRFRYPNVFAEGTAHYDTPRAYAAVAEAFPQAWFPSRLDTALDLEHDSAFQTLSGVLTKFALARDIKLSHMGDWTRGKDRTLYLYSRQSRFFVRLYEYRDHHGYGPPCRLELETKAKGEHERSAVAASSPYDMLLMCPATHEALRALGITDASRLVLSSGPRAPDSVDRDLRFLSHTAYPVFARVIAHCLGDVEAALRMWLTYRDETIRINGELAEIHRVTLNANRDSVLHLPPATIEGGDPVS